MTTHDLIEKTAQECEKYATDDSMYVVDAAKAIRALKSSVPNARILQDGEVAVPREPTAKMANIGWEAYLAFQKLGANVLERMCSVYRAMLSSSPQHSGGGEQKAAGRVSSGTQIPEQSGARPAPAAPDAEAESRSKLRRVAIQKGEPQPDFSGAVEQKAATIDMPPGVRAIPSTLYIPDAEAERLIEHLEFVANNASMVEIKEVCDLAAAALRKGKP